MIRTPRVWDQEPTLLEYFPKEHDYLLSIDESGTDDTKSIRKSLAAKREIPAGDRYLGITGVAIEQASYPGFKGALVDLKRTYWPPDGLYSYGDEFRRVCFHSTQIRKREGPFSSLTIDRESFLDDLTMLLRDSPVTVIAACVDKVKEVQLYPDPRHKFGHPYGLAMTFILERFAFFLRGKNATGVVLLESRGLKSDRFALRFMTNLLKNGTDYVRPSLFSRIQGIFFAPKWHPEDNQKSFVTLELADLFSYPIYQSVRDGQGGRPFAVIEPKFYNYPNYIGYGLKTFP